MGFLFPIPLSREYPLLVQAPPSTHFSQLRASRSSLTHLSSEHTCFSNQFIHLAGSSSKMPPFPLDCCQSSALFRFWSFFFLFSIYQQCIISRPIIVCYGEDQWMFLGASFWQCLWTQPVGYKIDLVFQFILMWLRASESVVMIYCNQLKCIHLNTYRGILEALVQGIWCIVNLLQEEMGCCIPLVQPKVYLKTRTTIMG